MKLRVFTQGAQRGIAEYGIESHTRITNGSPRPKDAARLKVLAPRIRTMAKYQLGRNFKSLTFMHSEVLLLSVKQGTSRGGKRFALRELFGWIALCDVKLG